jgi:hypothetical protein
MSPAGGWRVGGCGSGGRWCGSWWDFSRPWRGHDRDDDSVVVVGGGGVRSRGKVVVVVAAAAAAVVVVVVVVVVEEEGGTDVEARPAGLSWVLR